MAYTPSEEEMYSKRMKSLHPEGHAAGRVHVQ